MVPSKSGRLCNVIVAVCGTTFFINPDPDSYFFSFSDPNPETPNIGNKILFKKNVIFDNREREREKRKRMRD